VAVTPRTLSKRVP